MLSASFSEARTYIGCCEESNGVIQSNGAVITHSITHALIGIRIPRHFRDRAPRPLLTSRPMRCRNSGATTDHNFPPHYARRKKGNLISTGYAAGIFKTSYFCSSVCIRDSERRREQEEQEGEKQRGNLWRSSLELASIPGLWFALTLIGESHGDYWLLEEKWGLFRGGKMDAREWEKGSDRMRWRMVR